MEAGRSPPDSQITVSSLEFRLLGPLEVRKERDPVPLGGGRPRALLALLLVHRGEAVSVDRIVDELWGESPPPSARHMVEVYVSGLRRELGKERLVRESPGYRVQLDPEELDIVRFERLCADGGEALAAGQAEQASARLGEAIELWRGPALADFAYERFAEVEARRLEELKLHAEEEWVDAELDLGHAAALVARAEEQVARAPLRERRHGQLMRALAAAGRQADALAAYRSAQRLLEREYGLEPSAELRRIERQILAQEDGLARPAADEGEAGERLTRRVVTVLFAELVDGGHGIDPEVARAEAARALEPARRTVESHGGTAEELPDGTLMGVFGIPVAHEDDALRAVRAAAELRENGLAARAGVDTGEALAVARGVSGDVVRGAAQLRDAANAGEIVLGEQTRLLVGEAARLDPLWDEPLAAWRLVEVPPAGSRQRLWPPFVGRAGELAGLLAAFERAVSTERAQLVTVIGEPGIGKSRLGQELADQVRGEADVLVGRCLAYGEAITYWPLRHVVREAGGVSYEAIRELLAGLPNADPIARRVAGAVGLLDAVHPVEEVRWAVRRLLETLASRSPLVVGFDDLHWAEPAFLDLVDHLAETTQARILIVCLGRSELLEQRPAWGRQRSTRELLTLGPLSRKESSALLDGLEHAGEALEGAERTRIVAVAEGNPLYLEQLAAFAAERSNGDGDGSLPTSLRTLLAARLDRLSSGERTVIECASVSGRTFWLEAVRELLPSGGASQLARHVDSLVRRDLLEPRKTSVPFMRAFRFRHSLIQEAAYRSLPKQRRAEAHERLAGWIEQAPRAAVGVKERRVGHHLEQACRYRVELGSQDEASAELAARAAGFLALAAGRASTRGNPRAAASLLARACALLPRGDPQRRGLLPQLGLELSEAGDPVAAEAALAEAIDDAVAASDRRTELRARLELAAIHGFSTPRTAAVEIAAIAEEAIPVFEAAGDQASLARVWHVLGYVDVWAVRWDAGSAAFERALEHAREAGDTREEASLVRWIARSTLFGSTPAADGIERCRRMLDELQGHRDAEAGILEALASLQAMCGEFQEARELHVRGGRTYAELGQKARLARLTAVGTRIELLAGDRSAAERELRAAYELYDSRGDRASVAAVAASLARLTCEEGREDEAEEFAHVAEASAAKGDVTTQVRRRAAQAKVLVRKGELAEAEALAREAVSLTEGTQFPDWRADTLLDLAEVLRVAGRPEEANVAARDALRLYEAKGNVVSAEAVRTLLS